MVVQEPAKCSMPSVHSVDDFIPEEALDASFLEDTKEEEPSEPQVVEEEDSSR